ncbi:galactan 1,3-beta-galactosidase [Ilyonectria robusta]|uniref:galactan 1,3-beta-galactosidase n=1 Tax=Ilyonectria robusta TaxID=1079257 RepID=UPI001E8E27C2|nr:galactan 1,3-beta-galactosidase [Ilyonectria robusta]KAH8706261.1 galactan 1,3-beta-galactosidase [Ilyonectria robusta]
MQFVRLRQASSLLLLTAAVAHATLQIVPGATWTATNTGRHIQAHGAGIIEESGTYYMIGEDKTQGSPFQNINCYSSTNLVEWEFENALLSLTSSGDLGPNRVVERPKVIYNEGTSTYVMYLHIDSSNYGEAKVGVATSKTVCGDYNYLGSFRPLGFESRDIGLFQDDDGSAYLLTEDRPNGLRIDALSDDYLNVTESVYLWDENIESPAILKKDGKYFMFGSHLTGWNPNDNVYSYADSLSGPWSSWTEFADDGSNTYTSQTSYILPLGDSAIYMGDRWFSTNLMRSTYIWLPLQISGTSVYMANRVNWVPQVSSKTWTTAPSENWYEGEAATLSNGAVSVQCTGCSGGAAAGYIGGSSGGTASFSSVHSDATTRTTIRLKFANGDSGERYATVAVNGKKQAIAFLSTGTGQDPGSSVIHCDLNSGSANTVVITTEGGSYGPDIDRIMVPVK